MPNFLLSLAVWLVDGLGYSGLVALLAVESACPLVPSALFLPFFGVGMSQGGLSFVPLVLCCSLGCLLGGWAAYGLGAWGGRPLIERFGRYVGISPRDLDAAERFFQRRGAWAVLVARVIPGVRTLISFPAGAARMNWLSYSLSTFLGSLPWCAALLGAGAALGDEWQRVSWFVERSGALVLGLSLLGWLLWRARRASENARAKHLLAASANEDELAGKASTPFSPAP